MTVLTNHNARRWLTNLPEEHVFRRTDGRRLRNLLALGEALNTMTGGGFANQADQQKNDFSNWGRDAIEDGKLADDLTQVTSQTAAAVVVTPRVALLASRLMPELRQHRKKLSPGKASEKC